MSTSFDVTIYIYIYIYNKLDWVFGGFKRIQPTALMVKPAQFV